MALHRTALHNVMFTSNCVALRCFASCCTALRGLALFQFHSLTWLRCPRCEHLTGVATEAVASIAALHSNAATGAVAVAIGAAALNRAVAAAADCYRYCCSLLKVLQLLF
jgi:hypothetical protein